MEPIREALFDRRTVERNIERGLVTREDYEKWLAGLDDCLEQGTECDTRFLRSPRSNEQPED